MKPASKLTTAVLVCLYLLLVPRAAWAANSDDRKERTLSADSGRPVVAEAGGLGLANAAARVATEAGHFATKEHYLLLLLVYLVTRRRQAGSPQPSGQPAKPGDQADDIRNSLRSIPGAVGILDTLKLLENMSGFGGTPKPTIGDLQPSASKPLEGPPVQTVALVWIQLPADSLPTFTICRPTADRSRNAPNVSDSQT